MKLIEGLYILALVVCFAGNCASIYSGSNVTTADFGNYRYQVAIYCPVIMCSGAILSSYNVLTTASCINTLSPGDVQVYAGSNMYYSGGITYNVSNIVMHPSYDKNTYDSNMAILTVATPFDFSTGIVQSIALATAIPPDNSFVLGTAYGAVDSNYNLPIYLQRSFFVVYPRSTCQKYKSNRLTTTMFCVGDANGNKDFCPGDQGAQVVYQNKLVGIYNWGCSCGLAAPNPSTPVLNSITSFLNWIQSHFVTPQKKYWSNVSLTFI